MRQSDDSPHYAGLDKLWIGEHSLRRYNEDLVHQFTRFAPSAEAVLEFGAGIGTLARVWESLTAVRPDCLEIDPRQRAVLEHRGFHCYSRLSDIQTRYDIIYTSNVLEHIEDDVAALRDLRALLNDGGTLIVYVPAFQCLYSHLDADVGHYRRYGRRELRDKLMDAGFTIRRAQYSDSIGFLAWFLTRYQQHASDADTSRRMALYDRVVYPLSRLLDAMGCRALFGKSLLAVATAS